MKYGNKTIVAEINEQPWRNVIEEAIYKRREELAGPFYEVTFCSWETAPHLAKNSFGFSLNRLPQVHFQIVDKKGQTGYKILHIWEAFYFDMGLSVGDVLTFQELLKAISVAKVNGKLMPEQE